MPRPSPRLIVYCRRETPFGNVAVEKHAYGRIQGNEGHNIGDAEEEWKRGPDWERDQEAGLSDEQNGMQDYVKVIGWGWI